MNERIYLDILRAHSSASEALRKCDSRNRSARLRAHVAIKALRQACELLRQASQLVSERVLCRAVTWRCGLPFKLLKLQMRAVPSRFPALPAHLARCSCPNNALGAAYCRIGITLSKGLRGGLRGRYVFDSRCVLQRVPLLWGKM